MQTTSTEVLKSYIFNEPIVVDAARVPALGPASLFMVWLNKVSVLLKLNFLFASYCFLLRILFLLALKSLMHAARDEKNAWHCCD